MLVSSCLITNFQSKDLVEESSPMEANVLFLFSLAVSLCHCGFILFIQCFTVSGSHFFWCLNCPLFPRGAPSRWLFGPWAFACCALICRFIFGLDSRSGVVGHGGLGLRCLGQAVPSEFSTSTWWGFAFPFFGFVPLSFASPFILCSFSVVLIVCGLICPFITLLVSSSQSSLHCILQLFWGLTFWLVHDQWHFLQCMFSPLAPYIWILILLGCDYFCFLF